MKKKVMFVDANKNKVVVTIETERGYISMCGDMGSSGGQVYDEINPSNEGQELLVELWNKYHLKNVNEVDIVLFKETMEDCITLINEYEAERKGETLLSDLDFEDAIALIGEVSNEDEFEVLAIAKMLDLTVNELDDIEIDGNRIIVQGVDYIFGTDSEMDDEWDEELDNYLEEIIYPEIDGNLKQYFNDEAWKRDAKMDGRGHSLNRYDGGELYTTVDGVDYYAYRQ